MAPVHKTRGRNTTRCPAPVEPMVTSTGKLVSTFTSTPNQGSSTKQFECPLCVDVFNKFSQLQWHLLSMHPRREMIMNLIMERYGISETCAVTQPSATLDSQQVQEHSTFCAKGAGKMQPVLKETETTTHMFKVPFRPSRKAASVPQIKSN